MTAAAAPICTRDVLSLSTSRQSRGFRQIGVDPITSSRRTAAPTIRRFPMYTLVENLARDRMRQVQRDIETNRSVRRQRDARRLAKKSAR
jgi:hypothetical protein